MRTSNLVKQMRSYSKLVWPLSETNTKAGDHSVEENWTAFKEGLNTILNKHVPKKTISTRCDLPYITRGIKNLRRRRKRRWDRWRKTKQENDKTKYDLLQAQVKQELSSQYSKYMETLFEDCDKGSVQTSSGRLSKVEERTMLAYRP